MLLNVGSGGGAAPAAGGAAAGGAAAGEAAAEAPKEEEKEEGKHNWTSGSGQAERLTVQQRRRNPTKIWVLVSSTKRAQCPIIFSLIRQKITAPSFSPRSQWFTGPRWPDFAIIRMKRC